MPETLNLIDELGGDFDVEVRVPRDEFERQLMLGALHLPWAGTAINCPNPDGSSNQLVAGHIRSVYVPTHADQQETIQAGLDGWFAGRVVIDWLKKPGKPFNWEERLADLVAGHPVELMPQLPDYLPFRACLIEVGEGNIKTLWQLTHSQLTRGQQENYGSYSPVLFVWPDPRPEWLEQLAPVSFEEGQVIARKLRDTR